MTFNQYVELAMRTRSEYDGPIDQINCALLGLFGEGGEISEHIKKHLYQGHPLDLEEMVEEGGDLVWYVALLFDGIRQLTSDRVCPEDILERNVTKLLQRYPEGFDPLMSMNREG